MSEKSKIEAFEPITVNEEIRKSGEGGLFFGTVGLCVLAYWKLFYDFATVAVGGITFFSLAMAFSRFYRARTLTIYLPTRGQLEALRDLLTQPSGEPE